MSRRASNYTPYNKYGNDQTFQPDDKHLELKDSDTFDDFIRSSINNVAVLYVHAKWCQPCKQIAPIYFNLSKEYHEEKGILFRKLDGENDLCADKGIRRHITAFPTFLIFKNGNVIEIIVGGDLKRVVAVVEANRV
jgi:thioredoxin 1